MRSVLAQKINNKKFRLAVIGLGYVGLPLAVEFAKKGFAVTGIDIDKQKVKSLTSWISYIQDVPTQDIAGVFSKGLFKAACDYSQLKKQDGVIVCVPTPLGKTREPDISFIVEATKKIAQYLHRQELIVLESTTYPGTTEELVLPILEKKGFKVGKDFYLGFSPERVDPGNPLYKTANIPKVVGGVTKQCSELIRLLYSQIIEEVVPVSSARVAEMVKLLENTFRAVNIALINEICLMANRLNIDIWEVIKAAGTKPFGFMSFKPGPGLGGHCLPIDPLYLSWKARLAGFESRFIQLADEINSSMPIYVANKTAEILNKYSKSLKGSKILIIGVAYKPDVSDMRESPALEIIKHLKGEKAVVSYYDPLVKNIKVNARKFSSIRLTRTAIKEADCVLIITHHKQIDYDFILRHSRLVFDTRNVYDGVKNNKIISL
ncbi:MAG: nucleotide sugar dehydrogenase [Candidatus Omnitrophota bacterium]